MKKGGARDLTQSVVRANHSIIGIPVSDARSSCSHLTTQSGVDNGTNNGLYAEHGSSMSIKFTHVLYGLADYEWAIWRSFWG
ncbi:hypothetical protein [Halobacillus naozhouensis]|uniref:Uncharacterized protein n=1 Tax=Halobacillus naozhouensis TaxID=554880 RepID=A0ABY8IZ58_9BACI|nr:hypothetical protein [Halobacillus naozhouensis]WFT74484.1 hypothetical protein P9989_19360 [Halobacillus naozhouensis]